MSGGSIESGNGKINETAGENVQKVDGFEKVGGFMRNQCGFVTWH